MHSRKAEDKSYLQADLDSLGPEESTHMLLHMQKLCTCGRTVATGTACY